MEFPHLTQNKIASNGMFNLSGVIINRSMHHALHCCGGSKVKMSASVNDAVFSGVICNYISSKEF